MRYILDIKKCKFIGKGHEGRVYLTPEGFALKIFYKNKNAHDEVKILEKVKNSRFFPNVLFIADKMVLREYISGENLGSYLYKHGLSYNIAVEIIELVEEFKKLNFTRINIRSAHIFIDSNEKIKVIDPRKPYIKNTPYPKDIIHVLVKLKLFDDFLKYLAEYKPSLLKYWSLGYDYYIKMSKKKYFIKLKIC